MQTIIAETTKPPAYPFIIHQCQRAQQSRTTNNRTDPILTGPTRPCSPHCQPQLPFRLLPPGPPQLPSASRLVRFGEAVSRHTPRNPQEEKTRPVIFLSYAHVLLNFRAPTHKPQPVDNRPSLGITPKSHPPPQESRRLTHPESPAKHQHKGPTRVAGSGRV